MKRDIDKNYVTIIKQLTDENEKLKKQNEALSNSVIEMKEIHDIAMADYKGAMQEIKEMKKKYRELTQEYYQARNKYTNKMDILITKIGGADMGDKH